MLKVKINCLLVLLLFISWDVTAADIPKTQTCKDVIEILHEGDLVFISGRNFAFKQLEKDTMSWTSHVGIAFMKNTQWMVYESKIPLSKISTVCDFVNRANNDQVAVTRYAPTLTADQVALLKTASTQQLNIRYDLGFDYEAPRTTFCSKYIYNSYNIIGIQVGTFETLGNLLLKNPQANLNFWKTWFLGRIPYERLTITPASQLADPKFVTVYKSFSIANP